MNDLDQELLEWFENDDSLPPGHEFVESVMASIDRERRKTVAIWTIALVLVGVLASFVIQPVLDTLEIASSLLPTQLIEVEADWVQQLVSPVNSIATALALGVLLLRSLWRKITA